MKNIPCHFDKHCGHKEIQNFENASLRDFNTVWGGTITARYHKGIAGDGDNVVLVVKDVYKTGNQERLDLV